MHLELISELLAFARRNALRFNYWFDNERKVYTFRFQDQERTWGYFREVAQDRLDVSDIINTLKIKVPGIC